MLISPILGLLDKNPSITLVGYRGSHVAVPHNGMFFNYVVDKIFEGLVNNHVKFDLVPCGQDLGSDHDKSCLLQCFIQWSPSNPSDGVSPVF
jgi:hypothetical protein